MFYFLMKFLIWGILSCIFWIVVGMVIKMNLNKEVKWVGNMLLNGKSERISNRRL